MSDPAPRPPRPGLAPPRNGDPWASLPDRKRGVLYICTGAAYVIEAGRSAASVRKHCPGLAIALCSDITRENAPPGVELSRFDAIAPITDPHRRSKVDQLSATPFERTLYLDSDTRVCADLADVFDVLERFDIALTHASSRYRKLTNETWRAALPASFPQFNGGVIAYRRTPEVLAFLDDWSREYHAGGFAKDQVTLRELLWSSPLRIATLPPEYNLRYLKYLWLWRRREARPKILHLLRYHRYNWLDRRIDSLISLWLRARGDAGALNR